VLLDGVVGGAAMSTMWHRASWRNPQYRLAHVPRRAAQRLRVRGACMGYTALRTALRRELLRRRNCVLAAVPCSAPAVGPGGTVARRVRTRTARVGAQCPAAALPVALVDATATATRGHLRGEGGGICNRSDSCPLIGTVEVVSTKRAK